MGVTVLVVMVVVMVVVTVTATVPPQLLPMRVADVKHRSFPRVLIAMR